MHTACAAAVLKHFTCAAAVPNNAVNNTLLGDSSNAVNTSDGAVVPEPRPEDACNADMHWFLRFFGDDKVRFGCVCVCTWKMKNRDSLARKSHFKQLCGGYQAKNSGGQFISLASC